MRRVRATTVPVAVLGYDTTGDGHLDSFDTNADGNIDTSVVRDGYGRAPRGGGEEDAVWQNQANARGGGSGRDGAVEEYSRDLMATTSRNSVDVLPSPEPTHTVEPTQSGWDQLVSEAGGSGGPEQLAASTGVQHAPTMLSTLSGWAGTTSRPSGPPPATPQADGHNGGGQYDPAAPWSPAPSRAWVPLDGMASRTYSTDLTKMGFGATNDLVGRLRKLRQVRSISAELQCIGMLMVGG